MNRRKFIEKGIVTGLGAMAAGAVLPSQLMASEKMERITILHTNDVHSRLDSFPMDGSRNQGMGGVAARAALINSIRKENEQVLVFDAGDIFQGTPYFNMYLGEPEIKAMSMMGYDASTIGNHDFDGGIENMAKQLQHANFPILIANYDFAETPLENKTKPYEIFKKGKLKIGVFGIGIQLEGLVPENLYGKTVYHDPILVANQTAKTLRKKGCHLVICLSHLGDKYEEEKISDEILAKESEEIDLIIGGHTHRFFEKPRKYTNKQRKEVLVNQVGWAGIQLGRIDYSFSLSGELKSMDSKPILIANNSSK
jgi:5'-nucleotidase